jgi:NRPS condensation-like uncharacterized protein
MIERFALADEMTCYYDRPAEPANVHLEVRVPGRLDLQAVRSCVAEVLGAHPRIMARRLPARWRRGHRWEYPVAAGSEPVQGTGYSHEDDLDRRRGAFLSASPPLSDAPPLRFLLASGPGGDCLILNAHHAAFDGLSCLRLMREVAGAYPADALGAEPATDVVAGRSPEAKGRHDASPPRPRPGAADQRDEAPAPVRTTARNGTTVRIAAGPGGAADRPGYGAHLVTWEGIALAEVVRSAGVSVNDVLIAALMVAVGDWNEARGASRGLIKITMPVGDKAQAGPDGRWANLSRLTTVAARVPPGALPGDLIADVARQTTAAKAEEGPQLDLASRVLAAVPMPVTVKHALLRSALRVAGPILCDTSLVSNLGPVEDLAFGATLASQVWFSTSAHMPRGLSLGAVTAGGALRLAFRYRRALMSGADAAEFAGIYTKALDQFAGREAVPR